jgi:hypothetical protein
MKYDDFNLDQAQRVGAGDLAKRVAHAFGSLKDALAHEDTAVKEAMAVEARNAQIASKSRLRPIAFALAVALVAAVLFDAVNLYEYAASIVPKFGPFWTIAIVIVLTAIGVSVLVLAVEFLGGLLLPTGGWMRRIGRLMSIVALIALPTLVSFATSVARWGAWPVMTISYRLIAAGLVVALILVHLLIVLATEAGALEYLMYACSKNHSEGAVRTAKTATSAARRELVDAQIEAAVAPMPEEIRKAAFGAAGVSEDMPEELTKTF